MLKRVILGLAIISLFSACEKKAANPNNPPKRLSFDEMLYSLPGLTVTEIMPQNGYPRQFEIFISQPLDHDNPEGIMFNQQIFLSHVNESSPVVFMPNGHSARATTVAELSGFFDANQIYVAHRFMGDSRPDVIDWDYLTVKQAASDFHRVVELFKAIYTGKWVSYGAGKNGSTALFYRRFYPNDDATLVQVALISFAVEDPRYEVFLENVGDPAIRDKIKRLQIELLENRNEILPLIRNYMDDSSLTFPFLKVSYLNLKHLNMHFHSGSMVLMILPQCRIPVKPLNNCIISLIYMERLIHGQQEL